MSHLFISKVFKAIIVFAGVLGALLFFWAIPSLGKMLLVNMNQFHQYYSLWFGGYILFGIPCYYVLIQAWKIANNFGNEQIFVAKNGSLFHSIYLAAVIDSTLFLIFALICFVIGINPLFLLMIKVFIALVGFSFAFCVKILAQMVFKAADLQEESDFTI